MTWLTACLLIPRVAGQISCGPARRVDPGQNEGAVPGQVIDTDGMQLGSNRPGVGTRAIRIRVGVPSSAESVPSMPPSSAPDV